LCFFFLNLTFKKLDKYYDLIIRLFIYYFFFCNFIYFYDFDITWKQILIIFLKIKKTF